MRSAIIFDILKHRMISLLQLTFDYYSILGIFYSFSLNPNGFLGCFVLRGLFRNIEIGLYVIDILYKLQILLKFTGNILLVGMCFTGQEGF